MHSTPIATPFGVLVLIGTLALTACGPTEKPTVGEKAAAAAVRGVDRAKVERTLGHLEGYRFALTRYEVDQGGFPQGSSMDDLASALVPGYMPRLDRQDAWGSPYAYSSDGVGYTIASAGEDGSAGTADDVVLRDGVITPPESFIP